MKPQVSNELTVPQAVAARAWNWFVKLAVVFTVVSIIWYLVSLVGLVSSQSLPSPAQTLDGLRRAQAGQYADASLVSHLSFSLLRLILGVGIGVAFGLASAAIISQSSSALRIAKSVAGFIRFVPPVAVFPLVLIWWGISEVSLTMILAFTVFWPIFQSVLPTGALSVPGSVVNVDEFAESFNIWNEIRSVLLIAWPTLLAMEAIVASKGLGVMVWASQAQSGAIVGAVFVACLVGYCCDTLLKLAVKDVLYSTDGEQVIYLDESSQDEAAIYESSDGQRQSVDLDPT